MLCPTIVITFSSCTKINLFTLSHHKSYEVNLLPTTRLTSNSKTIKLPSRRGHIVSCACTSSNGFISGMVGWKFVFGQEDVESLFFKAQTFSDAIGIPLVSRFENSFSRHEFSCDTKMFEIFLGGIATTLSLWSTVPFDRIPRNYLGFYHYDNCASSRGQ